VKRDNYDGRNIVNYNLQALLSTNSISSTYNNILSSTIQWQLVPQLFVTQTEKVAALVTLSELLLYLQCECYEKLPVTTRISI